MKDILQSSDGHQIVYFAPSSIQLSCISFNKHIRHSEKLKSRAFIGYLIEYNSTNIFRIWISNQQNVIGIRDIIFNNNLFYDQTEPDIMHKLNKQSYKIIKILDIPASIYTEDSVIEKLENDSSIYYITDTEDLAESESSDKIVEFASNIFSISEQTSEVDSLLTSSTITTSVYCIDEISSSFDVGNIIAKGLKRERKRTQKYGAAVFSSI